MDLRTFRTIHSPHFLLGAHAPSLTALSVNEGILGRGERDSVGLITGGDCEEEREAPLQSEGLAPRADPH